MPGMSCVGCVCRRSRLAEDVETGVRRELCSRRRDRVATPVESRLRARGAGMLESALGGGSNAGIAP